LHLVALSTGDEDPDCGEDDGEYDAKDDAYDCARMMCESTEGGE
jgi:hypothetical protein